MTGRRPAVRASLGGVADLARAGESGTPTEHVRFEVHHIKDRPGYYRDVVSSAGSDGLDRVEFVETLTSVANGAGIVVGTSVARAVDASRSTTHGFPQAQVVEMHPDHRVFQGTALPSPSFVREQFSVIEGLVAIELEPRRLTWSHGRALAALSLEVARLAAKDAESPILSLQAPVQVPGHHYVAGGDEPGNQPWSRSSAIAVRFVIAVGDTTSADRARYYSTLEEYCRRRGFGLWISDSRPNHRAGSWFQILGHDAPRARAAVQAVDGVNGAVDWLLPITLVGPARIGSSHATLRFLRHFQPLSITSVATTALDDLAFIHLQLAVPASSSEHYHSLARRLDETMQGEMPTPLSSALEVYLKAIDIRLDRSDIGKDEGEFIERTAGYSLLAGPALGLVSSHRRAARPLWLSWELASKRAGLWRPIKTLYESLDQIVMGVAGPAGNGPRPRDLHVDAPELYPNMEYLISRDTGAGAVRAKAKLGVPDDLLRRKWPQASMAERGVLLSSLLEDLWLHEMSQGDVPPHEVTVAWREHWLGRWSSLAG